MTELGQPERLLYTERVLPNFGTFGAIFFLFPAITIISEPFDLRVGVVVGLITVLTIWTLLVIRAPKITVSETLFRVGAVSIARRHIGQSFVVAASEIFSERGPKLNPAAHKVFQGTVKTAIKISILDPEDPTPYWLISTRHPSKLVEILRKS